MSQFLLKYRNLLLLGVLVITLMVSYYANQAQSAAPAAVTIPTARVTAPPATPLEASRRARDETAEADMAALRSLIDTPELDAQTREDAAARLTQLVDAREAETALEAALAASGVAPCVAVVAPGYVTVATGLTALTDEQQALILTLAETHAGVAASGVKVVCAEE